MTYTCQICGLEGTRKPGPGRPRKFCPTCANIRAREHRKRYKDRSKGSEQEEKNQWLQ